VPTQLRRLDIFAALSRMESFGVAAIEAAACGLPVVVSDAPGLVEVTPNQRTGLVVPRNNPQAAAHAFEQLVRNASLRQQMGQTGRAHVMAQYGWPVCLEKMQQAYQQTLALAGKQADGAA
jgi:glycosyltransferase involved in cell wall biosynthesis